MVIWGFTILGFIVLALILALLGVFLPDPSMRSDARDLAGILAAIAATGAVVFGITTAVQVANREDRTPEQIQEVDRRVAECEKQDKIWYEGYCYTTEGYEEKTDAW